METIMKRIVLGAMAIILVAGVFGNAAAQSEQPLGDYARSVKKDKEQDQKTAAKVYDNDNLPSSPSISVVGNSSSAGTGAPAVTDTNQNAAAKTDENGSSANTKADDTPKIKAGESASDRKKTIDAWKDKIQEQKKKVEQLTKDLNDFQHSGTMPTAAVWPYNQNYQQGLADKQKALDQAKADLSSSQDEARKAGAPSSAIE